MADLKSMTEYVLLEMDVNQSPFQIVDNTVMRSCTCLEITYIDFKLQGYH